MVVFSIRFIRYFSSIMSFHSAEKPIVVILGSTGTGKSKLALEVASKYNGEIISADSMQIYKGLDIVTNKVTPEEQALIPHHMLDFLPPEERYNVVQFRNSTLPIIAKLHEEGKLPVIVGGTHYYVESILWNVLVKSSSEGKLSDVVSSENKVKDLFIKLFNNSSKSEYIESKVEKGDLQKEKGSEINLENEVECVESESKSQNASVDSVIGERSVSDQINDGKIQTGNNYQKMDSLTNEQLWKMLEAVDPEMASTYHPNNRRKILRSFEVWAETGVRHSEHLRRQSEEVGGAELGGRIRFDNVAVLWVNCRQDILDARLDGRVDTMLSQGLLRELADFHASFNAPLLQKLNDEGQENEEDSNGQRSLEDHYSRGILQSIGFKEFHEYLLLPENLRLQEDGQVLYREGVEKMKMRTRQYSRRQVRWIRNRFLVRDRTKIPVYAVDASDPSEWEEKVSPVAEEVVSSILQGRIPSTQPVTVETTDSNASGDKTRYFCEVCNRVFIGNHQFEAHMQGARHRRVLKKRKTASQREGDQESKSQKI